MEILKHEMRLDTHSKRIDDQRFKEEPEPTVTQSDQATILRALLAANNGKMLAKDAIEVRPFHADRKRNLLILRSAKG